MEEIYGVVNILKIPYDVVMAMPVSERKKWISRHNHEVEMELAGADKKKDMANGEAFINEYARQTASFDKNMHR